MSRKGNDIRRKIRKKRIRKDHQTLHSINAVRMISLLALRNNGYGLKRLTDFNTEFNTILQDVSDGLLDLSDILEVLEEETGFNYENLMRK